MWSHWPPSRDGEPAVSQYLHRTKLPFEECRATDLIRCTLENVLRVLGFLHADPSDDAAYLANVASLETDTAKLQALAAQERTGHIAVSATVISKKELKGNLNHALTLLSRLAVTATQDAPSMPVRLSIPKPRRGRRTLITGARIVVTEARTQQELLTKFGRTCGMSTKRQGGPPGPPFRFSSPSHDVGSGSGRGPATTGCGAVPAAAASADG